MVMRFFPILMAALVSVVLYLLIMEREAVLEFAGREPVAAEVAAVQPAVAPPEPTAIRVVVLRSSAVVVPNPVLVRGRTEAARTVEVRAETAGLVISDPLRKGVSVTEGEVLCRLDPGTREVSLSEALSRVAEAEARVPESEARVIEAQARQPEAQARIPEAESRVAEARARLSEAELTLSQATQLSTEGFATQSRVRSAEAAVESARAGLQAAIANVEAVKAGVKSAEAIEIQARAGIQSAQAGVQAAQAGVAAARAEIDRLTIRAPFGGLLETETAETGTLLQPGGLCATIVRLDPIKLVGFVPETEVGKLAVGAMAGARLADGREVQGQLTFLSRSADESTRTFRLEVEVQNGDLLIRDGQTAEIIVVTAGVEAHRLPSSALTLDDEGRLGVRAVEEDRAMFRPVSVLRDTVEGIWVTGLPGKVDVIVVGQEYVTDGVPVAATYREQM